MISIRFLYYYEIFLFILDFSILLFCVPKLVWDFPRGGWQRGLDPRFYDCTRKEIRPSETKY